MKKPPKVCAIIPARGGSKGIPRKNIQDVCGKPLVAYTIEQALSSCNVDYVYLNSEDDEIRKVGEEYGARIMSRPDEFYHDNTFQEVDRLLMWCVKDLESQGIQIDVVVLLYATAPLREVKHIEKCVSLIIDNNYDSALTLVEDSTYLWKTNDDGTVEPNNYDPATRGPRQKENWNQWAENKAVYTMKRDLLMETGCRLGGKIGFVKMTKLQSIDIDKPEDLDLVKKIMAK
jgi:CMP-N,N'-diacetyllegionaminic acid synthase